MQNHEILKFKSMLQKNKFLCVLLLILILFNISILIDLPYYRQILSFIVLSFTPGLLILKIFQIKTISIEKQILISLGLSISFLMFLGLFINFLLPIFGFFDPISEYPLLVSIDLFLLIFIAIIFIKNKSGVNSSETKEKKRDYRIFNVTLFIPVLFPFMSILGTYLMNVYENNILLILMVISILIYSVYIFLCHKKINNYIFSVSLYCISLALLLITGLTSGYFIGWDVHTEYFAFSTVISNLQWSMENFFNPTTATLSTSILPAIYHILTKINDLYIYKLVYNLLFAFTPVAIYTISSKYLQPRNAFIVAFFFISQLGFLYTSQSAFRYSIALLLFSIAIVIFFEDNLNVSTQKALLIIMILSIIVSHYGVAYYFFALIFFLWIATQIRSVFFKKNDNKLVSVNILALFFIAVFFWYSQLTGSIYRGSIQFGIESFKTIANILLLESRTPPNQIVFGIGTQTLSTKISVITHWISFIILTIGVLCIIWRFYKNHTAKINFNYTFMTFIAWISLIAALLIPFISRGYDFSRIYLQSLVLLAPAFYFGAAKLGRIYKKSNLTKIIIIISIILLFLTNTRVIPYILHEPAGVHFDRNCPSADDMYIYDTDVSGAEWLTRNSKPGISIYSDDSSLYAFSIAKNRDIQSDFFGNDNDDYRGYIYLRYTNVIKGKIFTDYYHNVKSLNDFQDRLKGSNLIFSTGDTEVYNK